MVLIAIGVRNCCRSCPAGGTSVPTVQSRVLARGRAACAWALLARRPRRVHVGSGPPTRASRSPATAHDLPQRRVDRSAAVAQDVLDAEQLAFRKRPDARWAVSRSGYAHRARQHDLRRRRGPRSRTRARSRTSVRSLPHSRMQSLGITNALDILQVSADRHRARADPDHARGSGRPRQLLRVAQHLRADVRARGADQRRGGQGAGAGDEVARRHEAVRRVNDGSDYGTAIADAVQAGRGAASSRSSARAPAPTACSTARLRRRRPRASSTRVAGSNPIGQAVRRLGARRPVVHRGAVAVVQQPLRLGARLSAGPDPGRADVRVRVHRRVRPRARAAGDLRLRGDVGGAVRAQAGRSRGQQPHRRS